MEVKKDLIGKKTPSVLKIAKKHGVSVAKIRRQLVQGTKVEREHTKKSPEAAEIARDHLAEIPDYYTRLRRMEKKAGVHEYDDEIERRHNATNARILLGAKQGKYWLNRSESLEESVKARLKAALKKFRGGKKRGAVVTPEMAARMLYGPPTRREGESGTHTVTTTKVAEAREELIRRILETTTTAAIGGRPMPFAGNMMSGSAGRKRNKLTKDSIKFAVDGLMGRKSSPIQIT